MVVWRDAWMVATQAGPWVEMSDVVTETKKGVRPVGLMVALLGVHVAAPTVASLAQPEADLTVLRLAGSWAAARGLK